MRIFDAGNMFPGFAFDPVTAIGTAVSVGSKFIGGSSSKSAASAQGKSDDAAIREQRRQFDLVRESEAPFLGAGTNSVNQLQWLLGLGPQAQPRDANDPGLQSLKAAVQPLYASTVAGSAGKPIYYNSATGQASLTPGDGFTQLDGLNTVNSYDPASYLAKIKAAYDGISPAASGGSYPGGGYGSLSKPFGVDDFHVDPGYEFALDQGQRALQRTQAANGHLLSGAAAKAMTEYSQGVADQQYGNAFDRYNTNQTNLYNRLMGLTTVGQSAASNQAAAGQNMANNVSDLTTNKGNSQAAGILGQNAAWQNGLGSIGNSVTGLMNNNSPSYTGTESGFNYGTINWN